MKEKTIKSLFAMALIAGLEAIALVMGVDGTMLSLAVAALAGLGGYELGRRTE